MNISHELYGLWAVHSGLVLAKTLVMSLWTAKRRFANNTFANPEDIVGQPAAKVDYANSEVERVRRCHLVRFTIFSKFYEGKVGRNHILLTFLSHLKKLHSILRF